MRLCVCVFVCVYVCLIPTIYETKAEPRQGVFVQIFISLLSVPLLLSSPPAQHSSNEYQIVAAAGATQSLFRLEKENTDMTNWYTITLPVIIKLHG